MPTFLATIRSYNPANDTATIEATGAGIIDTWLDGVGISSTIQRSLVAHGNQATVSVPDPSRLCEAVITDVAAAPGTAPTVAGTITTGVQQRYQAGRAVVPTNGAGAGTITITFPIAFSAVPAVSVYADNPGAASIGSVTATNMTVNLGGGKPNNYNWVSWTAQGNT